jgi:hypothetical protein
MTDTITKAEVVSIIEAIRERAPAAMWSDSGGTRDGWDMACAEIEKAVIGASTQTWEYLSVSGQWNSCRSMADAMMWAEDGREIRIAKAQR